MVSGSSWYDYSLFGMARVVCGYPIEQPLSASLVKNQGVPRLTSTQTVNSIYKKSGFNGFYTGGAAYTAKKLTKEGYRWPALAVFHSFWNETLPDCLRFSGAGVNVASAGCMATVESAIILPLDRLFVAKVNEEGYLPFFKKLVQERGISSLYSGFSLSAIRNFAVWGVFMNARQFANRKINQLDPQLEHPILGNILSNLFTASSLTVVGAPLDFMKTRVQMTPSIQNVSLYQIAKILINQYGFSGLYSGASFAFLQRNVQAVLGGFLLDKILSSEAKKTS